jgi:hypothetical protein
MQSLLHNGRGDKNSTPQQNGYAQMNGTLINNFDIKVGVFWLTWARLYKFVGKICRVK